jgi:aldehyde dehydrogenase (NAD+)
MVASIAPHRDELGLGDGLMLIDGRWVAAAAEESWSHRHPATGERVASFPVAGPADVDLAVRAARRAFDDGAGPGGRLHHRAQALGVRHVRGTAAGRLDRRGVRPARGRAQRHHRAR